MIHHPTLTPSPVVDRFPAHLHMNLLPRAQRRGVGTNLLGVWLKAVSADGAQATHVGVNRANAGGCRFWAKQGFVELMDEGQPEGRTIWMARDGTTGNRARRGARIDQ